VSVLVVLEHSGSVWHPASWEALTAAQQLGAGMSRPVSAAVIGRQASGPAAEAAVKKLDRVYAVQHELLGAYTPDAYTAALHALIEKAGPELVLFPHTYQVRDFAPKLATRFRRALASDVVGHRIEDGSPVFVRQLFQGKLMADVRPSGPPPWFLPPCRRALTGLTRPGTARPRSRSSPRRWRRTGSVLVPKSHFASPNRPSISLPPRPSSPPDAVSATRTICHCCGNWPASSGPSWLPLGRSVTTDGCRWTARWEARGKPFPRNSTSPWAFPGPSSTWSG